MRFYEPRCCRTCGKKVHVTLYGTYRRHFADEGPSGQRRLCTASGADALTPAEAEAALHRRLT
jgi:hypothetical protein